MDKSLIAALIVFIGFFLATLLILRRRSDFASSLEQYANQAKSELQKSSSTIFVKASLNANSYSQKILAKLTRDFDESQIEIPITRWLSVLAIGILSLIFILAFFLTMPIFLAIIIGLGFGFLFHFYFVERAKKKIVKEFQEEFPEALMSISGAITAGLSFEQGLEATAQQSSSQLGKQFQRALNDMDLGASIEDALGQVAKRTNSTDMAWLIDAVSISRETGTSVAPVLNTVASSIQERAQLRREIQSLTAEGMLSAYVVVALPFVIFAFLIATQPNYVKFFWTEPVGVVMGVAALGLIGTGWFWLKSIVKVKE
jgi:tight adherence protein B